MLTCECDVSVHFGNLTKDYRIVEKQKHTSSMNEEGHNLTLANKTKCCFAAYIQFA